MLIPSNVCCVLVVSGVLCSYGGPAFLFTGPVFVEFPIDTLYPYELVRRELGMKEKGPVSLVQRIINW